MGDWGCGTATRVSLLAAFCCLWLVVRTHKVARQRIDCSYYNNTPLLSPVPIVQHYFSSFVTFERVARWREIDGFAERRGGESIGVGGGELAVSL